MDIKKAAVRAESKAEDIVARDRMLDYSYWKPKVERCQIKMPKSVVIKIPEDKLLEICTHFCLENYKEDIKAIQEWVDTDIIPKLDEAKLYGLLFVKNGRFSNKFDAKSCLCLRENLAESIADINYHSIMFDAGGLSEVVIEERIGADYSKVPTIYNGLPYRPEFRVFYDFDTHEHLYTVNYWDYDYVYPHLHNMTDKLVFNAVRIQMDAAFNGNKQRVSEAVVEAMKSAEGLSGKWSIDILLDESDNLWLIDIAIAERSAYWESHEKYEKQQSHQRNTIPLIAESPKEAMKQEELIIERPVVTTIE